METMTLLRTASGQDAQGHQTGLALAHILPV